MLKKKKKFKIKFRKRDIPLIIFFVIGVLLVTYPFASELVNKLQYHTINRTFDEGAKKIPKKEVDERFKLAEFYNDALINPNISDPFTRKNHEKGIKEYARMLQVKETMGYVEIPKINQSVPIYAGTNEDILQIGAGHLEFTSLPTGGKGNHCVITAHSGLPKAKLFTDIHKLKKGDIFIINNIKESLAYEVDSIVTVLPTDFSRLYRYPGRDYCTLLTCTPYMINTHRLLVRGERTDLKKAKKKAKINKLLYYLKLAAIIIAIVLVILFIKKKIEKYITGNKKGK